MSEQRLYRLGILGSGKGSNAAALADACASGTIPACVAVVLSDVEDAGILDRARERGVPARFIAPGKFRTKLDDSAEAAFLETLRQAEVDLVVLAGFMRILKGELLRTYAQKVVNIHPALLPAFPGLAAWKQALDYGAKMTGVTVHFVDQGIDTGPIIAQESVPILPGDTPESLHARIQEVERKIYPAVIGALARSEVRVQGRRTILAKPLSSGHSLIMSNAPKDYKRPWQALEKAFAYGPTFEAELQKELSPNHPLYGRSVIAVAKHLGCGDVLFHVQGGRQPYAVVHLTYGGGAETLPEYPRTEFFDSFDDFVEKRMRPDSHGYEPSV